MRHPLRSIPTLAIVRWVGVIAVMAVGLAGPLTRAHAQDSSARVLVGDITTTGRIGEPALSYQRGRDLALGFISMAGGVMGHRPIEVVSIDPQGDPAAAARAVEDLKDQGAVLFMGGMVADVTLAAARAAGDTPFLAVDARLPSAMVEQQPNLFQLGPSAEALGRALASEVAASPATHWGVVAQDDYFGRALAHAFWNALTRARPDITLAMEHYVPTLSGDVGPALDAMRAGQPHGLLVGLRDGDLVAFVEGATAQGLLGSLVVAAPQMGSADLMAALRGRVPQGWVTTGYPCCAFGGQPHRSFVRSYERSYPQAGMPTLGALYGYTAMTTLATALERAWSDDPGDIAEELRRMTMTTPVATIRFDGATRQSSLPLWVGGLAADGRGEGSFTDGRRLNPVTLTREGR
ncbi:ABC transporter substrate-binding protein [Roseospira visakhapatnamensis]|uniref:Branched-chain amino acid transport system substrate-binding protein n=1 Tax=Roseospira visakhapatnamensis TaxID=390880 RepID=A0A7W6REF7_9PROT|nr:ABC transporter substrate-binding protein [Roseospira visakhapatnamensis]MBB4266917.1 branched-chain amino acid transport system substrate-binding protein [Roseospira visakhapatnamensis]